MRNRRSKRHFQDNLLLDNLQILSKILFGLIIICLLIFINSSISVKKSTLVSKYDSIDEIISEEPQDENIQEEVENNNNSDNTVDKKEEKQTPKETTINMAFTGDIMCHNTIYNDAFNKSSNEYDFSYIFDDIKYHIQTPDIAVGNLETTLAGSEKGYSGYPNFNTPEILAYNLKKLGFDVLTTANNHCFDTGYKGVESTIDFLDDADIAHTGTFKSKEAQNDILIKNVKGIKIAFLSYTYGTNGIKIPADKSYSVNLIDKEKILNQLSLAKAQNPDLICVSMHWGVEYQTSPNTEQKDLANFLFKNGADLIIGNHPHVLQPMEKREINLDDGSKKDGFIVYSLGNFIADQSKPYTRDSAILNLNITKNAEDKISINSATYTPIYTYKNGTATSQKFKLINLKNTIASIEAGYDSNYDKKVYNTFKTELENIKKIIGEEIKS